MSERIWGIVLAAGAGRRMGMPKALMRDVRGHWLPRAINTQLAGGVGHVIVALGAEAEAARSILEYGDIEPTQLASTAAPVGITRGRRHIGQASPSETPVLNLPLDAMTVIEVVNWDEGMGASLRTALETALDHVPDVVHGLVVTTVDTPNLPVTAIRRVINVAADKSVAVGIEGTDIAAANGARDIPISEALVQAVWHGRPGHPVFIGRDHWQPLVDTLHGDAGGRAYLHAHGAREVECSDTGDGNDVDH